MIIWICVLTHCYEYHAAFGALGYCVYYIYFDSLRPAAGASIATPHVHEKAGLSANDVMKQNVATAIEVGRSHDVLSLNFANSAERSFLSEVAISG